MTAMTSRFSRIEQMVSNVEIKKKKQKKKQKKKVSGPPKPKPQWGNPGFRRGNNVLAYNLNTKEYQSQKGKT